jgi:hypothetical protein
LLRASRETNRSRRFYRCNPVSLNGYGLMFKQLLAVHWDNGHVHNGDRLAFSLEGNEAEQANQNESGHKPLRKTRSIAQ